jgi:hypothetical protein
LATEEAFIIMQIGDPELERICDRFFVRRSEASPSVIGDILRPDETVGQVVPVSAAA